MEIVIIDVLNSGVELISICDIYNR